MRTLLIDSDILAYKESSAGEVRVDWDGDGNVDQTPEDFEAVKERVDRKIADFVRILKADRVIVCLSCERADNWRKDFYPAYKENRAGAVKPLHLMAAKEYMAREYETYLRPRLEADDVMGILSTHPKLVKGEKVIVSEDKDMRTIPGLLFNPDKDRRPATISPAYAAWWHMMQTLMGDRTDGYPGCPGIGPTKADRILVELASTYEDMWPVVLATYLSRKQTVEQALVQARIARICQYTDYDYKRKEVIPWQPPSI